MLEQYEQAEDEKRPIDMSGSPPTDDQQPSGDGSVSPLAAKMSARVAEIARRKQQRTKSVDLGSFKLVPRSRGMSPSTLMCDPIF